MKLLINKKYAHLRPFIEQIPKVFEQQGREIYHLRNIIKVFETPDGIQLNVKRYHIPRGLNRFIYSFGLRKPKGQRAYEFPAQLLGAGINTPEPVAYIEERRGGLIGYSYFISLQCPYEHTLYDVKDAREGTYEELAKALGKFAARMHEKRILHLDFTPGNILWQQQKDGTFNFSLVDINRMKFGNISMKEAANNLCRFWGPQHFVELTARSYAEKRGFNADRMAEATLIARKHFWKHYLKKHDVPFHVELNTPTRILIVRFRQMGDAILSTPVCNTLRKNFPHAVIDFVLNERIAPLFEGHPSIDNIITFDERERHSTLTYLRKIWHVVHQHHYDVIIDMRSTVNTLPFALFSPSTDYRIGLCKSYTRFVYNYKIEPCQRGESMVSHNLQLLSPLQVETDRHISLCISKEEISKFQAYMEQEGIDFSRPIMLAGVTAKLNNKTWKMEWMTETLHRFMQTYPNVQIIFNYAPGKEEENAREIYVDLHQDKRIFIDIQAQSARQLAAMASLCTFYFGNEGGARHIVQAMQRPSFAICSPIADKQTWISQDSNILSEAVAPSDITDEIHGKSYEELYDLLTVDIVWKRLQTFCQQLSI